MSKCEYEVTRTNPQTKRYSRSLKSETRQNVTTADNVKI